MSHHTPLIATIVAALSFALVFGVLAHKLRLPAIVGYLLAGVAIGPHTPGLYGDLALASELSEIGIILLMFGVGLHFSPRELADARGIALPGALMQMGVATALGWALARLFGWDDAAGIVFGLSLAVASTVVALRSLGDRGALGSRVGHVTIGWLVVEDLAMVLAMVLVPVLPSLMQGGMPQPVEFWAVGLTLAKAGAFVVLMLVLGPRVLPWLLSLVGGLRSRELFSLAALVAALGVAFMAYALFGVSFALGAFLSGMVLGQSPLSQKAAEQTLPFRDAFAVLFFVAVGMLFNPAVLVEHPLKLLAMVLVVLLGQAVPACIMAWLRGMALRDAVILAAALAQIGEFSFILAGIGVSVGLLPEVARDLILATALLTIALNPLVFRVAIRAANRLQPT